MIAVIDSGVANLTSVLAALERLDVKATATRDPRDIRKADKVILPGVGSAQAAMARLEATGLIEVIRSLTQPTLGICLGMQLLFEASEEGAADGGLTPCLGVMNGVIRKLAARPDAPIPHMGWNTLTRARQDHPLLKGIENETHVYFVHSFAAQINDTTLATCDYGQRFAAMCASGNFLGCQFHPERSGRAGHRVLQNFCEMRD